MKVELVEVRENIISFRIPLPIGTTGRGNIHATVTKSLGAGTTITVKMTTRATIPAWKFAKILEDFLNWIAEEARQVFFLMERIDSDVQYTGHTLPLLQAEATLSVSGKEQVFRAIIEKVRRDKE